MATGKLLGLVGAVVAGVMLLLGGGFMAWAGFLALDLEENGPKPPVDLEVLYRQAGLKYGVDWAALAAWDGVANGFVLPLPTERDIYHQLVAEELDWKRRADERWCKEHPKDTKRCPPSAPFLTEEEYIALAKAASQRWMALRREYVEGRARVLASHFPAFYGAPESVYSHFLDGPRAGRAAELYEAYLLAQELEVDSDRNYLVGYTPPVDWVPVAGFAWPVEASLTSRFGWRFSPIDGQRRIHAGIDLAVATGTPIRASKSGVVVRSEWDTAYGLVVVLDHGGGYRSLYAHNSALLVRVGQLVGQGHSIALAGSTGYSTGPHLHFEIHYHSMPVDPLLLLSR